jgi:2-polyprenyl-3-methyl-5-hydroxy-6-metoxy-1,4-benzoquinol methylase
MAVVGSCAAPCRLCTAAHCASDPGPHPCGNADGNPAAGLLPASLAGLRVLELGAGIGRFTGLLAAAGASHVHAVDFMANLIEEVRPAREMSAPVQRIHAIMR